MSDSTASTQQAAASAAASTAETTEQAGNSGTTATAPKFEPITSQEEFDRRLADRLRREREKYSDYDDLKAAAARLAEIEEANKTEEQKRAERIAELEAKVNEYETREQIAAWKAEVAEATGVPAAALAGSTKEEIEAHAETLKPLIAQPNTQQQTAQTVPTIGNQPDRPAASVPLKDQIAAAEKAGDKALVAALKAMQLGSQ